MGFLENMKKIRSPDLVSLYCGVPYVVLMSC